MLGVHEEDTETLLALLESSLGPDVPSSQGEMLEALVAAGGNVNQAAQSFKSASSWEVSAGSSMRPSKRRKLENSLSGWLVRTKSTPSTSSASLVSGTSNTSPSLPVKERPITCLTSPEVSSISETRSSDKHVRSNKNYKSDPPPLLSILKAPPFSPKKKISPPPLLLGTPELVTKYTPTTLHHSVLPNGMYD
ncbi:uncharacterized protein EI90DRAFT_1487591 [Cantharellus anzutake]|uniref:uncharacterized protein n=1 Tax=Cantharellus anzutake TaxID=1750568 RepID=UPI0019050880|nr:uncharacterized protein EI90DRAFT_1487591 [Cantharellus anzutake]KAF8328883.1 hypothetical protein EI90DRAFT_1487591 [Cantharellus anzutake]